MKFLIIKKNKLIYSIFILTALIFFSVILSLIMPKSVTTASLKNYKTNEDRISFLNSFGWQVEEEPYEAKTIIIPVEFNNIYTKYNDLQISQGYDLNNYRGQTVKRWTYSIQNYPKQSIAYASIYIFNDKIIAGDVYTTGINGIMHGFKYPNVKAG